MKQLLAILPALLLAGCDAAEINKICDPSKERQFNVVYNAHYDGQFTLENTCGDTATVFITEQSGDPIPPGDTRVYTVSRGLQYIVIGDCADSTLTYTFVNECP